MAHVKKDIATMRKEAAKEAQRAADLRKAGKRREALRADMKARFYIDRSTEMRVMKQAAKKKK